MIELHEAAVVARPLEEVFDYVSDFTTTTEWDATALQARKLTPGAVGVGTRFEVICALPVGSITINYQVEELQGVYNQTRHWGGCLLTLLVLLIFLAVLSGIVLTNL